MGPEASSEFFNINGSSKAPRREMTRPAASEKGTTWLTRTVVQSTNTSLFLNVGSDSTSYKTLTFGSAASTSAWALEGDTIITAQGSTWGRRELISWPRTDARARAYCICVWAELNFLACKLDGNFWQVYLQTGSATPSGATCSNYQSLHLPCLC